MHITKGVVAFLGRRTTRVSELKQIGKINHVFPLPKASLTESIMNLLFYIRKNGAFEFLMTIEEPSVVNATAPFFLSFFFSRFLFLSF